MCLNKFDEIKSQRPILPKPQAKRNDLSWKAHETTWPRWNRVRKQFIRQFAAECWTFFTPCIARSTCVRVEIKVNTLGQHRCTHKYIWMQRTYKIWSILLKCLLFSSSGRTAFAQNEHFLFTQSRWLHFHGSNLVILSIFTKYVCASASVPINGIFSNASHCEMNKSGKRKMKSIRWHRNQCSLIFLGSCT